MTKVITPLRGIFGAILALLVTTSVSFAQQDRELANQLIDIADEIMKNTQAMDQARENYVQAATFDPENIKANYKAGEFHLLTIHKDRAADYFIKVKALDEEYRFDIDYKIAISLQYGHKFAEAIEHFNAYKQKVADNPDYDASDFTPVDGIDKKIEECKNGIKYLANPQKVDIVNLGNTVNGEMDDFAPMFNEDGSILIFTSRRRDGNQNQDVHEDNKPFEDIFFSEKKGDSWDYATNLGQDINSTSHDSNLAMSPDGTELYIYIGGNSGDIFITKKNNKDLWSDPVRLDEHVDSENFAETSLCFSPDGSMMIFSSNRPFGEGDFDLYYSMKQEDGSWGKAVNLGKEINTEFADDGPFLDYDGKTLFFSSKGHVGMGGYDIYKSEYDSASQVWSKPQNLGYPINTADDDIYYITSKYSDDAYYASVHEDGYGHTDIYKITAAETVEEPVEEPVVVETSPVTLKLKVIDAISGEQLDAKVELTSMTDKSMVSIDRTGVGTFEFDFDNENRLNYKLHVENVGYVFENTIVSIPAKTAEPQVVTRTISLNKPIVNTRRVLRNVYFDFDKSTLLEESFEELNSLAQMMKDNSDIKIEISGHTDNIGGKDYNKELSQRRADAIKEYLAKNGVSASRVQSVGYGEERPLASNDDEKEGREINRRVEFIVIK